MSSLEVETKHDGTSADEAEAPRLGLLLGWFQSVITHPESAAKGRAASLDQERLLGAGDISDLLTSTPTLSALDRAELYHHAYFARLVDCLTDDYPVVRHAIGETAFDRVARDYIRKHPSNHPNLNLFGGRFPAFLAQNSRIEQHAFLADLARLEWAMVEAVHAEGQTPLTMEEIKDLPPERFFDLVLTPSASLRCLAFDYPVNRYLQQVRERSEAGPSSAHPPTQPSPASPHLQPTSSRSAHLPPEPSQAKRAARRSRAKPVGRIYSGRAPEASWSATAVYRQDGRVWRMNLTRPMFAVLSAILSGMSLGLALQTLENFQDEPEPPTPGHVTIWFKEWVSSNFFLTKRF